MNKILFTSDLHIGHAGILRFCPERPFADNSDIEAHDKYMLDLWKKTVDPSDTVYVAGDLSLLRSDCARPLVQDLPGKNTSLSETMTALLKVITVISTLSVR